MTRQEKGYITPEYCDVCGYIKEQCVCEKDLSIAISMKPMDNREAIELQQQIADNYLRNHFVNWKTRESCKAAIEAMMAQNSRRWIPVEEKLPEEKEDPITLDFMEYNVTCDFGNNVKTVRTYKYGNGHWWNGAGIMDEYVIAWQCTPEPYTMTCMEKQE